MGKLLSEAIGADHDEFDVLYENIKMPPTMRQKFAGEISSLGLLPATPSVKN